MNVVSIGLGAAERRTALLLAALACVLPRTAAAEPALSLAPRVPETSLGDEPPVPAGTLAQDPPAEDAPEPEEDSDDGEEESPEDGDFGGFEVIDLTEDEEALKEELKVETPKIRGEQGKLRGRVIDKTSGEPLIGAYVEALGTDYQVKTDLQGDFELPLPAGSHDIRVRYDTFETREYADVAIAANAEAQLKVELNPLEGASQRVVVEAEMNRESGGAQLLQRKEATGTQDIMSRDDIEKSGGGSTASVAQRIVGATIINGKYLFIRGLGHRYGNTLFDRARLSSPDPDLRTVQLDIVPSGGLSAINVRKSFTPDLPADFAGGSTNLETRETPDETMFEIGLEIGANTATTGRTGVTRDRYPGYDSFGYGYIPLGLPKTFPEDRVVDLRLQDENLNPVWTPQEIEEFGEALHTKTRVISKPMPINFGVDLTAGHTWHPGKTELGIIAGVAYKNAWSTLPDNYRALYNRSSDDLPLERVVEFEGKQTEHRVAWGALNVLKWKLDRNHKLEWSTIYTHDSEDQVQQFDGFSVPTGGVAPIRTTRNRYTARSLFLTRLGGRHVLPKAADFLIDWFGAYTQARNSAPMRDMVFRDDDLNDVYTLHENNSGLFLFPELVDNVGNGAIDLALPFKVAKRSGGKLKAGAWIEARNREFLARRFRYESVSGTTIPTGTGNILNDDTIGQGPSDPVMSPFYLRENNRPEDSYDANQQVYASYLEVELPLAWWFRVSGGGRFEASNIAVQPFDFSDPDREYPDSVKARLRNRNWLPALALVFSPREDLNVRVGGSQTVARPEFRELAPFQFPVYSVGLSMAGNPSLQSSTIWNADARVEWFPSSSEVLAAGVFYKYFDDPIERVMLSQGAQGLMTFGNADHAHNVGAELEIRKNLEFLAPEKKDVPEAEIERRQKTRELLAEFSIGINAAYIYSTVNLGESCLDPATREECLAGGGSPDISTSRERPLMDQSPYVANIFFGYDSERFGTHARLLYNTFGRRIDAVGVAGLPDVYLEAQHRLDFVFKQRAWHSKTRGHELNVSGSASNLLNWRTRYTQGGETWASFREGVTFTLGVSFSL